MKSSSRLAVPFTTLFFVLLLSGCELFHGSATVQEPSQPATEHGYALLFDLMGDEQDVSKLRFIKHERPELKILVKEISRVCGEAYKQLAAFGKADAGFAQLVKLLVPVGGDIAGDNIAFD